MAECTVIADGVLVYVDDLDSHFERERVSSRISPFSSCIKPSLDRESSPSFPGVRQLFPGQRAGRLSCQYRSLWRIGCRSLQDITIVTTRLLCRGSPLPIGATATPSGINFVLICRHGTAVWLVLSETCSGVIHAEIPLDPHIHRTGDHWHVRVDGLPEEFCYGYRVDGPHGDGHRYDPAITCVICTCASAVVRPTLGNGEEPCRVAAT